MRAEYICLVIKYNKLMQAKNDHNLSIKALPSVFISLSVSLFLKCHKKILDYISSHFCVHSLLWQIIIHQCKASGFTGLFLTEDHVTIAQAFCYVLNRAVDHCSQCPLHRLALLTWIPDQQRFKTDMDSIVV